MAETTLSTTSNSGTQDAAGNSLTQPATGTSNGGTPTESVQPVVGANALNTSNGVSLQNRALPTINLSAIQGSSGLAQPVEQPRQINPALFGFSALLLVIAVVMFWSTRNNKPAAETLNTSNAAIKTPVKGAAKKSRKKRNVKKKN